MFPENFLHTVMRTCHFPTHSVQCSVHVNLKLYLINLAHKKHFDIPDGPRTAVKCPLLKQPLTLVRIVFVSEQIRDLQACERRTVPKHYGRTTIQIKISYKARYVNQIALITCITSILAHKSKSPLHLKQPRSNPSDESFKADKPISEVINMSCSMHVEEAQIFLQKPPRFVGFTLPIFSQYLILTNRTPM